MIQSSDAPSISIRLDRIALLSSGTIHNYSLLFAKPNATTTPY